MVLIASAEELPAMSFFGDASSKEKDFMVAGGFAVAGSRIAEIEWHINDIAGRADMKGEFHWSAYGGGKKRQAYEELVEYAFGLTRKRHAALHVIIAKFHGYAHKANKGEKSRHKRQPHVLSALSSPPCPVLWFQAHNPYPPR